MAEIKHAALKYCVSKSKGRVHDGLRRLW